MEIEAVRMTVGELTEGYIDRGTHGVTSMNGRLNIRPAYQREFVYKDAKRDAVIETVMSGFPLNVMFFGVNDDDTYEVIDGQQRLISLCQYVKGDYSVAYKYFHNLTDFGQKHILDYDLITIFLCRGTTEEKLEWFKRINVCGEPLTDQELRNSVYTGPWLTDVKRYFSATNCPAAKRGEGYITGIPIRQTLLEQALEWICCKEGMTVEEYMALHQHDEDGLALYEHFRTVIDWAKATFTVYRKEMKHVDWGRLWHIAQDKALDDPAAIEERVRELMMDDDVTNKKGIYEYIITGKESCLSIRAFTPAMKRSAYERQNGICARCGKHFDLDEMEGDHISPHSEGGATTAENCQMLCKACNRKKSNI